MANTSRACQTPLSAEKKFNDHGSKTMPISQSSVSTIVKNEAQAVCIPSPKFNHLILEHPSEFKIHEVQLEEKVKNVSRRMSKHAANSLEGLVMVDTIQRLGIDHLFQEEIKEVLRQHYVEHCHGQNWSNDLHEVSLRFRLLRQGGYHVSAHTFDKFLDQDGKFKQGLGKDIQELVSLFEASQMSMQGESILDEANDFSKKVLSASLENLDESHARLVQNTLKHPLQKSLARFSAQDFLSTISNAEGWRKELRELMKMEFNMAQTIYQNELIRISDWWKELGLAKEMTFARDQPLKWHMWSLAMLPDRSMSEQRLELTKPISFIYIIDDIFDVYGTPEDLSLFTEAVNRWEFDTLEMLPEYMKICLKALFDVTDEISHRIWLKYGCNPKDSLQKAWMDLCDAYMVESKWFATGHLPTAADYLKIGTISSGVHVVLVHMFFLLGGGSKIYGSNRVFLDKDYTRIISSTAMILRLWNDLGGSEDEGQDGHDGSYIKCYMNEQEGVTIDVAREHVIDLISDAWKSLNEESLQSLLNPFSSTYAFTRGCLNLARMVPLMYSYDENHELPDLEKFISSLLYQHTSITTAEKEVQIAKIEDSLPRENSIPSANLVMN